MRKAWILLAVLAVAGYFAVFGGEYSWLQLRRLQRERQAQQKAVQATRQEVKVLRARADSLERDSLAMERLAREKYGLIRNGERLYRFAPGATPPPLPQPAAPRDSSSRSKSAPPLSPHDTTASRQGGARPTPGRNP